MSSKNITHLRYLHSGLIRSLQSQVAGKQALHVADRPLAADIQVGTIPNMMAARSARVPALFLFRPLSAIAVPALEKPFTYQLETLASGG